MLCRADAAFHLLREEAWHTVFAAVEQRLSPAQPKSKWPGKMKRETKSEASSYSAAHTDKRGQLRFIQWFEVVSLFSMFHYF